MDLIITFSTNTKNTHKICLYWVEYTKEHFSLLVVLNFEKALKECLGPTLVSKYDLLLVSISDKQAFELKKKSHKCREIAFFALLSVICSDVCFLSFYSLAELMYIF